MPGPACFAGVGGLLVVRAAAADHLGSADQEARIDAERIADDAENDDGADAEAATAHREAKSAPAAPAIAASIFNVVALRQIFKAHSFLLSPRRDIPRRRYLSPSKQYATN